MKTMTIYGPNGEPLKARKKDFFNCVKSEKEVCLVCRCNDPLYKAWFVKYIGPGYYHGVCPYCQTEIGIEKPDKYARLSGGGK